MDSYVVYTSVTIFFVDPTFILSSFVNICFLVLRSVVFWWSELSVSVLLQGSCFSDLAFILVKGTCWYSLQFICQHISSIKLFRHIYDGRQGLRCPANPGIQKRNDWYAHCWMDRECNVGLQTLRHGKSRVHSPIATTRQCSYRVQEA